MMQADGTGIALRPEHRMEPGPDTAHPGIKKPAEVVAVADFTPDRLRPGLDGGSWHLLGGGRARS
jgi:hypothetical protein